MHLHKKKKLIKKYIYKYKTNLDPLIMASMNIIVSRAPNRGVHFTRHESRVLDILHYLYTQTRYCQSFLSLRLQGMRYMSLPELHTTHPSWSSACMQCSTEEHDTPLFSCTSGMCARPVSKSYTSIEDWWRHIQGQ